MDRCREALTAAASDTAGTAAEQTVLVEVVALRTILLNLVFRLGKGEAVASRSSTPKLQHFPGGG